jgi:hypothetical protein
MSAGGVFQAALRLINRQELSVEANRDVLPVLEAARRKGPLAFLWAAATEAGLDTAQAFARTGALYVGFCAGNLCDDLIDGECTYLPEPLRQGPSLQYLLQNVMVKGLLAAGLPGSAIEAAAAQLARSASYSHLEIRTKSWTAPVYRLVAEEIAGRQWAAHLSLLWWATPLAPRAEAIAQRLAIVGHVAEDIRSSDVRLTSLGPAEHAEVLGWARAAADELRSEQLDCVRAVLAGVDPVLGAAS